MWRTGERIARAAALRVACSAAIFDTGKRILLTRRSDNGRWCLPSGALDPGETVTEACEREVLEETGLVVRATRLIGVYSSPHRVAEYPRGERWHVIDLLFAAEIVGGTLGATQESSDARFYSHAEAAGIDLMEHDRERMTDAFGDRSDTVVR